jgi:L-cysteine/cystine lyase
MESWQRRALADGRAGMALFMELFELRARLRATLARLIGAEESSIALTTSTTEGCNVVVAGLRLRPGDQVVTTDVEHPGLLGALRAWELNVRIARVRDRPAAEATTAFDEVVSEKTRLIALSHVAWTTGAVLPVRELAGRGIPVLVDGAQGAGAVPVDVNELGCDFYTVSGQKWLLGPDATGCLYVRDDRVSRLAISYPSYLTWEDTVELEPWPDARRFESAWTPPGSVSGLLASLSLAREVGEVRFEQARRVVERCRDAVAAHAEVMTESGQGTLVSFRPRDAADAVVRRLEERGVVVRDLPGLGWVRASCGFWTSEDDLERLVDGL